MVLLDLFCGAGGCSKGYHAAGFDVVGVDINPQPHYPFEFIQADAMTFPLRGFDAIHASPPCQRYTTAQRIQGGNHPDLVDSVRDRMPADVPWVIENVAGSPLRNPITLCGMWFGLGTYRHRLFESNVALDQPPHLDHVLPITKMGRPPKPGEMMHVVGNFSGIHQARNAMGIYWMTRDEIREAIPPAYTEWIGKQLMRM